MINYFFYTEYNKLNLQSASDAFGPFGSYTPSSGPDQDQFRVTNLHSSSNSSPLRAFAITKGSIAAQFDKVNPNIINIIIKPLIQPEFSYAPIRYFIIKGILKNSLLDATNNITNETELGQKLIEDREALNQSKIDAGLPTLGPATYKTLGLHLIEPPSDPTLHFEDSEPIDNLFYHNNLDFTPIVLEGGSYLGNFDNTKFGIEIILDAIGYQAPLSLTRNVENYIRVDQLSATPTNAEIIINRNQREKVLQFGDACSFYGAYFNKYKFKAKTWDGTVIQDENISGNEVYNKILQGTQHTQPGSGPDIGTFFNRNKIVIDIRNEYNNSFNLFKNYSDSIQISYDEGVTYNEVQYYTNNWPYLTIENNSLPQSNNNSKVNLSFRLSKIDNSKPLIYISQGFTKNFRELKGKRKFIEVFEKNDHPTLCDEFSIVVPNYENNGSTRSVSSFVKLRYLKLFDSNAPTIPISSGSVLRASNSFDHLFFPVDMKILFNTSDELQSRLYEDEIFVDQLSTKSLSYIAASGISKDSNNVTFFSYATERYKKKLGFSKGYSLTGQSTNEADTFARWLYQKYPPSNFSELTITTDAGLVKLLTANPKFGNGTLIQPDVDELIIMNIFNPAFEDILNLINNNTPAFLPGFKIYFGLINETPQPIPGTASINYTEFDLVIRGFIQNGTEIEIHEINTSKKIYL